MKSIVGILAFLTAIDASAKILVGKTFISTYPAALQENVFEYQIINKGNSSALNVEIDDSKSFPTDRFEIRRGSARTKFPVIAPNTIATHHIVVVPLNPQPMEDKDVIVDYTDAQTRQHFRMSAVSHEKRGNQYYFSEKQLYRVTGINYKYFVGFAGIALPLTLSSLFFYWLSSSRYDAVSSKRN